MSPGQDPQQTDRGNWASGLGFVLAATGSAVGLGNIWRFPYITGENGGGMFVLLYLACIVLVGLPVMIAEVMIGRATQRSPVSAFKSLGGGAWTAVGWLGVIAGFTVLSFYAVIAGWAMHYAVLALRGAIGGLDADQVLALFNQLQADGGLNLFWLVLFMAITVFVVLGGVRKGIERWSTILMPCLLVMLIGLALWATGLEGFGDGFSFVFGNHSDELTAGGVLEALGHSFFTLSLGMGAMMTYGSYLSKRTPLVKNAVAISVLDTVIALLACMVLFPILFTAGLDPAGGAGLVFITLPIAFAQLPAGDLLAFVFFALLVFAALTSAISLLEVPASYLIDERGWSRRKATIFSGIAVTLVGIPSALTGATVLFGQEWAFGRNWFDLVADGSSNVLLPLGGLGIALFVAWRIDAAVRQEQFADGGLLARFYLGWLTVLRYVVPVAILAVFGHVIGLWSRLGLY